VTKNVAQAQRVLAHLAEVGIEIDQITQQLEDEGVHKFDIALDRLLEALEQRRTYG
jgi:transaldolase